MPKKQRNAFYFYMLDYRQEQENLGRRFNGGLRDVQEEAGELWKDLPASVRSKYDKRAKDYKSNGHVLKKYTSTGEEIDAVRQRKQDIEDTEQQKREVVINMVSDRKTATNKLFFVIDVNYYCQTRDLFVINEVAIVAYNILTGLELVFHKIIDPVCIPLGYTSLAKDSYEEHCFRLPPLENGERDKTLVLSEMMDFLQHCGVTDLSHVPLFTLEDRSPAVQSFLDQICGDYDKASQFVLYPLSTLLFALSQKLSAGVDVAMPHESVASIALRDDKFQYCPNLACDFHEDTDKYFNCTKSRVKRWVYTILDYCCPLAGVEMISGDHLPDDVDPGEAARIKMEREEQREQELREQRERENDVKFSFIDYAAMEGSERQRLRSHVVRPAFTHADDNSWPTLGGPVSTAVAARPGEAKGVWGKPSGPGASSSGAKPGPSAAPSKVATPLRNPLRIPECMPEGKLIELGASTGDSIGIMRGRGRGSVTSIYDM